MARSTVASEEEWHQYSNKPVQKLLQIGTAYFPRMQNDQDQKKWKQRTVAKANHYSPSFSQKQNRILIPNIN